MSIHKRLRTAEELEQRSQRLVSNPVPCSPWVDNMARTLIALEELDKTFTAMFGEPFSEISADDKAECVMIVTLWGTSLDEMTEAERAVLGPMYERVEELEAERGATS